MSFLKLSSDRSVTSDVLTFFECKFLCHFLFIIKRKLCLLAADKLTGSHVTFLWSRAQCFVWGTWLPLCDASLLDSETRVKKSNASFVHVRSVDALVTKLKNFIDGKIGSFTGMGCTASRDLTHLIEHRQLGTFAVSKLKSIERATVNNNGHVAGCLTVGTSDKLSCHSEPSSKPARELVSRKNPKASNRAKSRESPVSVPHAHGLKKSVIHSSSCKSFVKRKGHSCLEAQGV